MTCGLTGPRDVHVACTREQLACHQLRNGGQTI